MLNWLINSENGLLARIAAGVVIFAFLGIVDYRRNGPNARRWREYLFLLICVVAALAYGLINDQITVGISWEYFYYGKGLESILGPAAPPAAIALRWEAAKVGMQAVWSAGLILGVILLLANNPGKRSAPLRFGRLYRLLPLMLACPAILASLFGVIGYWGGLVWLNAEFPLLLKDNLWRPYRFMAVYGIHLGGYIGGLLGVFTAVGLIIRQRRSVPNTSRSGYPPASQTGF